MLVITDGCFEVNAAYPENDFSAAVYPSDLQQCQNNCKKKQECRVFTWTEGLDPQKKNGVCKYKTSKRKKGKVLRDGDKKPERRKVSGSVRNEENQQVWCKGTQSCFKIHLTSLL